MFLHLQSLRRQFLEVEVFSVCICNISPRKSHIGNHKIHFILHLGVIPIALWETDEETSQTACFSSMQGSSLMLTLTVFFLVTCSASLKPFPLCQRAVASQAQGFLIQSDLLKDMHCAQQLSHLSSHCLDDCTHLLTVISCTLLERPSTLEILNINMIAVFFSLCLSTAFSPVLTMEIFLIHQKQIQEGWNAHFYFKI